MSHDDLFDEVRYGIRGLDRDDKRFFTDKEVKRMLYAQQEIRFLIDRNYPIESVVKFVGDRYQFSSRQRLALQRATCKTEWEQVRKDKCLILSKLKDGPVYIDGFNLIITLEVALSGGVIVIGQDNCARDLAGIRGNYRIIDKTIKALKILCDTFTRLNAKHICFYLDAPVSNSGVLKFTILEMAKFYSLNIQVDVINNPDTALNGMERVITSDAIILDACQSYFNLAAYCIGQYIPEAFVVQLDSH